MWQRTISVMTQLVKQDIKPKNTAVTGDCFPFTSCASKLSHNQRFSLKFIPSVQFIIRSNNLSFVSVGTQATCPCFLIGLTCPKILLCRARFVVCIFSPQKGVKIRNTYANHWNFGRYLCYYTMVYRFMLNISREIEL